MEEHCDRGGNILEFISGANEGLAELEPSQGFLLWTRTPFYLNVSEACWLLTKLNE